MPKFVVYETKENGKDYVLATVEGMAAAMKELKRRKKLVKETSVVGMQDKEVYLFIKKHQEKELKKNGN
jgi:hypothetical protein